MQKRTNGSLLFLTFYRYLNRNDKLFFYFFLVVITAQLFFTFIKLEVTPFFLYGMFSQKLPATDTFTAKTIWVNGKPLSAYRPMVREALMLDESMNQYLAMKSNNNTDVLKSRIEQKYPFFYRSAVYPFFEKRIYNTTANLKPFEQWYRQKCSAIAGSDSVDVLVTQTTYRFYSDTLRLNPVTYDTLAAF